MGKPSKARGRGGTFLGGRNAAPAGASGRAKGLRNGANNRREQVDEHIPASLVTASDEEEDSDADSEEGTSGSSEEDDEEEGSDDDEAEDEDGDQDDDDDDAGNEEDLDSVKIAVPVAMWVSDIDGSIGNKMYQAEYLRLYRTSTIVILSVARASGSPDTGSSPR